MSTECLFPNSQSAPLSLPPHPHDAHSNSLLYNPQRCTSVQLVCTFKYLLPGLKIDFGGQTKQGKRQVGGPLTRPTSGRKSLTVRSDVSNICPFLLLSQYLFENVGPARRGLFKNSGHIRRKCYLICASCAALFFTEYMLEYKRSGWGGHHYLSATSGGYFWNIIQSGAVWDWGGVIISDGSYMLQLGQWRLLL